MIWGQERFIGLWGGLIKAILDEWARKEMGQGLWLEGQFGSMFYLHLEREAQVPSNIE